MSTSKRKDKTSPSSFIQARGGGAPVASQAWAAALALLFCICPEGGSLAARANA
jgi:hypothetical protein